MRGGALPPALLAAALGFALAFAPRRVLASAIGLFVVAALMASLLRPGQAWVDPVFYACWASVVVTAGAVHVPKRLGLRLEYLLAANAGLWAGLVIAVAGAPIDLAKSLPLVLICFPGTLLVARNFQIGLKVVAGWLIAVSLLAAALPAITPTPGYAGDHME